MPDVAPVAVVIPTYNRLPFLQDGLERILGQPEDVELVVVDDGSSDGTPSFLAGIDDRRLTVITHSASRERAAARNAGLEVITADWVLFLDDDDRLHPSGLRTLTRGALEAPVDCVAVLGRLSWFSDQDHPQPEPWVRRRWTGDVLADCVVDPWIGPNRALVRTSAARSVGGWDAGMTPFEDWLFALRIAALGSAVLLPEVTVERRSHSSQSDLRPASVMRARAHELARPHLADEARRQVTARAFTVEALAASHDHSRGWRRRRLASAIRILRSDRIGRTPLSRISLLTPLVRFVLGTARPRRQAPGIRPPG